MTAHDLPGALSGDELAIWSAFATVLEWTPAELDAQLQRDSGISHFEFGVLFALHGADDRTLRMSQLAGFANSTLSRLSRAVSRLESQGWVQRSPDPDDGRSTLAVLTDQGVAAVRAAAPGHFSLVRALVFDTLTAAQARQLGAISRRVAGAIRPEHAWTPTSEV